MTGNGGGPGRKILMLSEQYLPLRGGHIVFMHELARRIGGVTVLTAREADAADAETIDGVRVLRTDLSRRWYLRPESLGMYVRLLARSIHLVRRERPAAIVAARVLPEGYVATRVGRMFGLPTVVFAHGEEITPWLPDRPGGSPRGLIAKLKKRCVWSAYHAATRIVANSRFTRSRLALGGIDKARVSIVHPGTDPEQFKPEPPDAALAAELGAEGRRVMLTVGRVTWRKGQDTVVRAMPQILRDVPDALYLVAGSGPMEGELRELIENEGLHDHVRLLGTVGAGQLARLYHMADVYVMPGRVSPDTQDVEGFGIVFLEAGACEVPVIGGRVGGMPDAVADGETGLLVDGEDVDAVAEACRRLLTDRELARRMGRAGRQRVIEHLSWDRAAEQFASLLETVISTGAGATQERPAGGPNQG